ncbi:MAG: enoyl-CoA hydratase/isomerase family protein [Acidimicrobiales bacterium]
MTDHSYQTVRLDGDGALRHLVFNRPEVHNAVNDQFIADVHQACRDIEADPGVRVVIVRGDGPSFCSGADLKLPKRNSAQAMVASKAGAAMYDTLLHLSAVTIAACHGYLIGGGGVLPAACDFRIGAPSVRLTLNEVSIGFNLTWHSLPVLVNLVGPHKAKEMLILGRTYDAEQLDQMGFWTETVNDEAELVAAAERLAGEVLRQPPVPVTLSKASINAQALAMGRAIQHMDHVAAAFMGRSENSRIAQRTYFGGDDGRDWVAE